MYSELYVVQHRAAAGTGRGATGRPTIGYFTSFAEAAGALDGKFEPGCWQGIRHEATQQRWWRDDSTTDGWHGLGRAARR